MSEVKPTFEELFTAANAEEVAKYIVSICGEGNENSTPPQNIDYDFKLVAGKFISKEVNTWFKFDTAEGTLLRTIRDTIADETIEATPERIEKFDLFIKMVSVLLETKYAPELLAKIRKNVVNNLPPEVMPLAKVEVKVFEVSDLPALDWVVAIKKLSPKDYVAPGVAQEIISIALETGEEPANIIRRKKEEGDNRFKYVDTAYKKKYWYECQLDLYVDYSLAANPPAAIAIGNATA